MKYAHKAMFIGDSINVKDYIPPVPRDLLENLRSQGFSPNEVMVFRRDGKWDRENKRRHLTGTCTACGKKMPLRYQERHGNTVAPHDDYLTEVKHDALIYCPKCDTAVRCKDIQRLKWGNALYDKCRALVFNRMGDKVVCAAYNVCRLVNKQGRECCDFEPVDLYIFGFEVPLHYGCWWTYGCAKIYAIGYGIKTTFSDSWLTSPSKNYVYPFDESLLAGTCLENSKVLTYLEKTKDKALMGYCHQYLMYPGVENLTLHGFHSLVKNKVAGGGCISRALKWRQTSPSRMLELNRDEQRRFIAEGWSPEALMEYKRCRAQGHIMTPHELSIWRAVQEHKLETLKIPPGNTKRVYAYLQKQANKLDMPVAQIAITWRDYINAAIEIRLDLAQSVVLFPPKLEEAHARAISARKYTVDPKLRKKFKEMYEKLLPLAWEHNGLLIRPAKNQRELIIEGKMLSHCVGGYGSQHCEGAPIFFLRSTKAPDIPYLTLQLSLSGLHVIQNRGFHNNDRGYTSKPQEVTDFEKLWLETVVRQYDFKAKQFKNAKNKPAA